MQIAGESVEPLGDIRADMRAAANTIAIVSALAEIKDGDALGEFLLRYLPVNKVEEPAMGPGMAAKMMGR